MPGCAATPRSATAPVAFPAAVRRARSAEVDHTRDHASGGATSSANLGQACPHDHDVKDQGGWRLNQPEPGVFVWYSPLGGEYRTRGEFLLPEMPDPCPADLGPDDDRPAFAPDRPILLPYRPVERPRPPPPAPAVPPVEPPF